MLPRAAGGRKLSQVDQSGLDDDGGNGVQATRRVQLCAEATDHAAPFVAFGGLATDRPRLDRALPHGRAAFQFKQPQRVRGYGAAVRVGEAGIARRTTLPQTQVPHSSDQPHKSCECDGAVTVPLRPPHNL